MRKFTSQKPAIRAGGHYLVVRVPSLSRKSIRSSLGIALILILTNFLTHYFSNPKTITQDAISVLKSTPLYLSEKAAKLMGDIPDFEKKVREIAKQLNIAPEWLMAIMDAESGFDVRVLNRKGSGAVGLIQFMPTTAAELNVSTDRLRKMNPIQQLEYVYLYLQQVRDRYGDYNDLTDLYLAVLYPKARNQDPCYTLYSNPSQSYKQNSGLDENRDGRVTVSDIDKRMMRMFQPAYVATVPG